LEAVLDDVAAGRFPPADSGVTIVPMPSHRDAGVIGPVRGWPGRCDTAMPSGLAYRWGHPAARPRRC